MVWRYENVQRGTVDGHPEVNDDLLGAARHPPSSSVERHGRVRCKATHSQQPHQGDIRPVRPVCLSLVKPGDRRMCPVGVILPLFESNS